VGTQPGATGPWGAMLAGHHLGPERARVAARAAGRAPIHAGSPREACSASIKRRPRMGEHHVAGPPDDAPATGGTDGASRHHPRPRYSVRHVASTKLDQASGRTSRPGRRRRSPWRAEACYLALTSGGSFGACLSSAMAATCMPVEPRRGRASSSGRWASIACWHGSVSDAEDWVTMPRRPSVSRMREDCTSGSTGECGDGPALQAPRR